MSVNMPVPLLSFSTYPLVHAVLRLFTRIINLRFFSVSISHVTDFRSSELTLYMDIKFTCTVNKGLLRRKSYKQVYVFSAQMVFSFHWVSSCQHSSSCIFSYGKDKLAHFIRVNIVFCYSLIKWLNIHGYSLTTERPEFISVNAAI